MGLDMYLEGETFAGLQFEHNRETAGASFTGDLAHVQPERLSSVTEQLGYWRKANAIHKWFVDNVQGGVDDCRRAPVSRAKLTELRAVVERVLASCQLAPGPVINGYQSDPSFVTGWRPMIEDGKIVVDPSVAEELLPATSGFFFGSTQYDSRYVDDLKNTLAIIDAALSCHDSVSFFYEASW